MKNTIRRILFIVIVILFCPSMSAQLTNEQFRELALSLRMDYLSFGIEGSRVYNVQKKNVLVTFVTMKSGLNSAQENRAAQIIGERQIREYLQGSVNTSISIYETKSTQESSFNTDKEIHNNQVDSQISSELSSEVKEQECVSSKEILTDRIVQEALSKISTQMQMLSKFTNHNGEDVYVYMIYLSKSKSHKKH